MKLHLPISVWPILLVWALGTAGAQAVPVSHLEVKIVTGAEELGAGSSLELRIYEAGKGVTDLAGIAVQLGQRVVRYQCPTLVDRRPHHGQSRGQ